MYSSELQASSKFHEWLHSERSCVLLNFEPYDHVKDIFSDNGKTQRMRVQGYMKTSSRERIKVKLPWFYCSEEQD